MDEPRQENQADNSESGAGWDWWIAVHQENEVSGSPEPQGSLDRLMTYTTFHIGMYATICAALMTFLQIGSPHWMVKVLVFVSIIPFTMAGAAGGIIAGNLSHYDTMEQFRAATLKARVLESWGFRSEFKYDDLARFEHEWFWVGLVVAVGTLFISSLIR